eukprot:1760771-Rhodomonas_salina.2
MRRRPELHNTATRARRHGDVRGALSRVHHGSESNAPVLPDGARVVQREAAVRNVLQRAGLQLDLDFVALHPHRHRPGHAATASRGSSMGSERRGKDDSGGDVVVADLQRVILSQPLILDPHLELVGSGHLEGPDAR